MEEKLTNALTAFDMSSQLSFKMFKAGRKCDLQYKAPCTDASDAQPERQLRNELYGR